MTTEEFKAWLSGYLEDKSFLRKKHITAIQKKLKCIDAPYFDPSKEYNMTANTNVTKQLLNEVKII